MMKPKEAGKNKKKAGVDQELRDKEIGVDCYGGLDPLLVELSDVLPSSAFENVDLS